MFTFWKYFWLENHGFQRLLSSNAINLKIFHVERDVESPSSMSKCLESLRNWEFLALTRAEFQWMAAEENSAIFDEKFEVQKFEGCSCKSFQDG